jgi:3-oxoacyl-[acyl-carrier-protein] synthase I
LRDSRRLVGPAALGDTAAAFLLWVPVANARLAPAITAYTATTALGAGLSPLRTALRERRSGLRRNDFGAGERLDTWIGRVDGVEAVTLPAGLADWDCRNNRLAWLGLQQDDFLAAVAAARARHGADRIALVLGTSTASIGATEEAYTRLDASGGFPADLARAIVHTPHSLGGFVQQALGLGGPAVTVATACSSSAKVFAQAARLIAAGFADAAVVGGVDTLCGSVLFGFNALQLVSDAPCRPFDAARRGLSLGEAAGFALLEPDGAGPQLLGYGESSDAHHMSSPHPQGLGAQLAMQAALRRAGVAAADIDYINLHGTATPINDEIEAAAIARLFPASTHASSTKGWTGHTLGAAGIVESVIALNALVHGELPGLLNCDQLDPQCGPQIRRDNAERPCRYAMNNSFGFGGNNCSLLFGAAA